MVALRSAENLSIPKVQVVVLRGNMSCNHCRDRVSEIISKMNGLLDYVVDLTNKEVTVTGVVHIDKMRKLSKEPTSNYMKKKKKKFPSSLGFLRIMCLGAF